MSSDSQFPYEMTRRPAKALFAANTAWSLVNFRLGLIRALIGAGWEVIAVAPSDDFAVQLTECGCRFLALPMDNKGVNPIRDLGLFFGFIRLLRQESPTVYLGSTIKPNVYGSVAAHMLGIPVLNNITGLGTVFIHQSWVTHVARLLYKIALFRSRRVFFENSDDRDLFVASGLVSTRVSSHLPISGVNVERFATAPWPSQDGRVFCFTLISRMLWDKGIGEFVEAARLVRNRHPKVVFRLLGFLNTENQTAIPSKKIQDWEEEGIVTYLGTPMDVRPFIADADCVVLPSYREGLPIALLEAASMARPIITTDTVGCRDVVEDGINGYLVNVRDAVDLANKMEKMLSLSREELFNMGQNGRRKVECKFDDKFIVARYMEELKRYSQ